MKNIGFYLVFIVFIVSCKSNHKNDEFITAKYKIIEKEQLLVSETSKLLMLGDVLYWTGSQQEEQLFFMNINDLNVKNAGIRKGRGPEEFGYITSLKRFGDKMYFFDLVNKKIFIGKEKTFKLYQDLSSFDEMILDVTILDSNFVLISGVFDNIRMGIVNNNGILETNYNSFPDNINDLEMGTIYKNMGCYNVSIYDEGNVANIIYDAGIIEFFRFNQNSLEKIKEIVLSENKFQVLNNSGNISIKHADSNTGFIDIKPKQKSILALYSSVSWEENADKATYADCLFEYNRDGDLLNSYKLKYPISRMAIYNNSIIGLAVINKEVKLIQYFL